MQGAKVSTETSSDKDEPGGSKPQCIFKSAYAMPVEISDFSASDAICFQLVI